MTLQHNQAKLIWQMRHSDSNIIEVIHLNSPEWLGNLDGFDMIL